MDSADANAAAGSEASSEDSSRDNAPAAEKVGSTLKTEGNQKSPKKALAQRAANPERIRI